MIKKMLLPNQSLFLQAPFLFPDRRYHMHVAGYGAGKTSADAQAAEYISTILQGKTDKEGHRPRVLLGGVTIGHLEKTTLAYIIQDLENSKTVYKHDTKNNILRIGSVDILITPLQNPGEIMGYDVCASILDEVDDLGLSAAEDVTFEAVKAVNERTRQIIPGMRRPFIMMGCFGTGTEVLTVDGYKKIETIVPGMLVMTRSGYKRVLRQWRTGFREVINLHGISLTPEHPVWDEAKKDWAEARYIDSSSICMVSSYYEAEKWKRLLLSMEQALDTLRFVLTEYHTIGYIAKRRNKDITEVMQVMVQVKDYMSQYMQVSTEKYKMDILCITSTVTRVIINLTTLRAFLEKNTIPTTDIIDTLSMFVLSAERSNTLEHQIHPYAKNASMKNESRVCENEQGRLARVLIKVFGKNGLVSMFASTAGIRSCQEKKMLNGVASVPDYALMNRRKTGYKKNEQVSEKDCTPVHARYAEETTQQKDLLHSVHRSVVTGQELLGYIQQLVPVTSRKLAGAAGCSERVEDIKTADARLVPVYDLEVEGSHEFFVRTNVGDILVHNSTSQGQKGLYRLYTQFKKAGTGFTLVRGRTADNYHLDPTYVRSMYEIYNERERRVYLEGEFLAISKGQVFGDFDWDRNFINDELDRRITQDEVLYWGQDFNQGYHRGCVAVVRDGIMHIIKNYEFAEMRDAPRVVRYDFPSQRIYMIPDTTAKDQLTHFTRELRRNNVHLIMRSKNPLVEDTAFLVNKMLFTKRIIVTAGARETAEDLSLAQRDKDGNIPKGKGPSSPIHRCDGVRLIAFFLACNRREFADIRKLTVARRLDIEEDGDVKEMSSGFYDLSPQVL